MPESPIRATVRPSARPPGRLTLGEDDRRTLAGWAADCAERVLDRFEAVAPDDPRPRSAIDGLRRFARGEAFVGELRSLSVAAHAAARAVAEPSAVAAARAAGHAAGTAHMAAHSRGAPAYATLSVELGGPDGDVDAVAAETRWQVERATPAVRAALGRLPVAAPGGGRLGGLIRALDERLADRA